VALGEDGTMSFQVLQNAFGGTGNSQLIYFVFDLLFLDGLDLRAMPLYERKRRLAPLLTGHDRLLRYSDHIHGQGRTVFETACRRGLEGLIAKLADGKYVAGRNRNWVKVKCHRRQEFVIGGFTDPAGSRRGLGALLLGVYENRQGRRRFMYVGRVGTGFSEARLSHLHRVLGKLERPHSPFINPPTGRDAQGVHWVTPKLVAEIQFSEWTQEGLLRHPSFLGLRDDKPARTIVRELPNHHPTGIMNPNAVAAMPGGRQQSNPSRMGEAGRSRSRSSSSTTVAGVRITHPHRVLYGDDRITKLDLARYYETMAEWILPHLRGRPLTIVRCPEGHERGCFYQKHVTDQVHEAIDRVEVEETEGRACYMVANTTAAIIALVQLGVLELHTWGAKQNQLDRPDRMTLDLDPAPGLPWEEVIEAAHLMRTLLDELNLKSFVKTTGGKGLHVVVPLQRNHSWDEVKGFSKALAEHMTRTIPARFTDNMSKRAREGKVYIDFLRNGQGATAVAAYSTRAKPGAPVSVPLAWDEVSPALRSDQLTMRTVSERLSKLATDPWADYFTEHQHLTLNMRRRIGMKFPPS
jgi:bifunctional non-homologous end joining protein LigD